MTPTDLARVGRIQKCRVAAPLDVPVRTLRTLLESRGIEVIPEIGQPTSKSDDVRDAILGVDLLVGIAVAGIDSNWTLIQIGFAVALGRPALLILPPDADPIPAQVQGLVTLRTDYENAEAIGFALDQILSAPPRVDIPRTTSARVLGSKSPASHRMSPISVSEFESDVRALLLNSGVEALSAGEHPDHGADFAVWADSLETVSANPLLIELKMRVVDKRHASQALEQLTRYIKRSSSRYGMVLYGSGPLADDPIWSGCPFNIFVVRIDSLRAALAQKSFAEYVIQLRNLRVHGLR
jgi:hypothetical protein